MIKLLRAADGCLGIDRRRRTRKPAIIFGELEKSFDPEDSEWGNPIEQTSIISCRIHRHEKQDLLK